jgi:hypothetical protein
VLSPSWHASVNASSSDIYDNDWEKRGDARLISKRNVIVLYWFWPSSNNATASLAVLCYEIRYPIDYELLLL